MTNSFMSPSLSGLEQCLRFPLGVGHVLELHHWRCGSARHRLSRTGWTIRRGQHNIVSLTKFHINNSLLWSLLLGLKIRNPQLAVQEQQQPHPWQPRHGLPHQWPQARWRESHYERHHCGICRGQWGDYLQKISDNMTPLLCGTLGIATNVISSKCLVSY